MSALADRLRERIQRNGPITFYEWMKAALYEPELGYYCRSDRERWGRTGDYRTSPERSFLFGATFARYFNRLHAELGHPSRLTIVESGAGDGRFAEAVLRGLQQHFPKVLSITQYVIDEASTGSRSRAIDRLGDFSEQVVTGTLKELEPLTNAIFFANELLDAFPVHRIVMQNGKLREFHVEDDHSNFAWTVGAISDQAARSLKQSNLFLKEGQVAELNPGIEEWLNLVSQKLLRGYLVIVDYGAEAEELYDFGARPNGSLRAFHRHRLVADLLANPGEQDLTSSVNWILIKTLAEQAGFEVQVFERQDKFLLAAGLLEELESEVQRVESEGERARLRTGAREMILPGGMSESFQVLVVKKG